MRWQRYITWLTGAGGRWLVAGVILCTLLSALGISQLELASDYRIFFDKGDSRLAELERMQEEYTKTDNVFVMVEPDSGSIYRKDTIGLILDLTDRLWQIPYASRVDSLTNYPRSKAIGDDIVIEELVYEDEPLTEQRLSDLAKVAPTEQDLVNKLISPDGRVTGVNLTLSMPGEDTKNEVLSVDRAVDDVIADLREQYPDHHFYVSGIVPMNAAFFDAARSDFITLIPLMMVFVVLSAGLILGSMKVAGIMLLVVLLAFSGSLGLAGWLGIKLSAPSISAPIIMFTVIVASSIHILSYVMRQRYQGGATAMEAVRDSYSHSGSAILLSHITTLIGFTSMNWSDSPPFRDLGNIVALGILFSLALVFTLLPRLLAHLRIRPRNPKHLQLEKYAVTLSEWVIRRRLIIVATVIPATLALSWFSLQNRLNDNLVHYFSESVPFRQDAEAVDRRFSGIYSIDYSVDSNQERGIFQPEFLAFADRFERWLADQPEVVTVDSLLHRFKDLNRLTHGDEEKYYRLPENATSAAQLFLLYEMSLPFGKEPTNQVNMTKSALKLSVRMPNQGSQGVLAFEKQVESWLEKYIPEGISVTHTSPAIVFSHVGQSSISSLLEGALLALVLISILLLIIFRSVVVGLVSLIPNIIPVAAGFGTWYFLVGEVSMGLAGVSAMVIGVVVDDTVHFLFQYVRNINQGFSPEDSVRHTFRYTKTAIMVSSLLLMAGFLLLSTSSFEKNAQMGQLTSLTIFYALVLDLVLLPALAMLFIKQPLRQPSKEIAPTNDIGVSDAP
ncbi:efflux RND transporter permease subunit [Marinimicrobium locisalis]|uniref:efflux RND transporter permease subunit n=1 Tax=Marinimicrobium locisalis TaxID=546022 RepID=UPI003221BA9E